ncbi:MAG: folate-binding protein [Granulosicoccus sp.]|nr:folate-binding protein [Granulosicoccus sp.]
MPSEWTNVLRDANLLALDDDNFSEYGQRRATAEEWPQLVDLSYLGVLEVTGSDAESFLQAQLCNDFTQVAPTQAQITGYCTPKGRLLGLPVALMGDNAIFLIAPISVVEPLLKRLSMFVLRAEVRIKQRSDLLCLGLIAGDQSNLGQAGALLGKLPDTPLAVSQSEQSYLIRWHDDLTGSSVRTRYIHLASVAQQIDIWNASPELAKAPSANWQLADIAAGIPTITSEIAEQFVPQMINLQLIDALSFTKGCYPGQEIVARMQYLGKLKRQMRLFRFDNAELIPLPGEKVSTTDDSEAGVVVNAVGNADGEGLALVVVKKTMADQAMSVGNLELSPQNLPYSLADPAEECAT